MTVGLDFSTGKPKRVSRYASTREEAVKVLHEMSFLCETAPRNFSNITLGEWLDMCLEVYMKNSLKQSTYVRYEGYIRIHYKPALGALRLKDLTPRLLQQFYNYKAETEGLDPKTLVSMNLYLHKAPSYAVSEGYIPSNPASAINLPQGSKPQIEILTRDEQASLLRATYRHRYGVFVRLVLFTGIRMGELLGLRWEDIDVQSGLMHIRRTLNRLKKKEKTLAPGESKNVAGLRHFTFHALRHTFASRAMEQGMDAKTLSMILGHASVSFTMDTYTHVLNTHKVESMALMGELFDMGQTPHQEISYPVIATPLGNGEYSFSAPNFPGINFSGPDLYQGLQHMKEHLQEELLTSVCPPEPMPANQIILDAGQLLLQIPV